MRIAMAAPLLFLLGCRGPVASARASRPAPAVDAPAPRDEFVLADGKLTLPDGTTVERVASAGGLSAVEFTGKDHGQWYSYLEPGDAEVISDTWMFTRDLGTGTYRVWRWEPRAADISNGATATLRLGDRAESGEWSIEWVGVALGSSELTGTRVMMLRSVRDKGWTDYWQYPANGPAKRDFATRNRLHHFEVEVVISHLAREAHDSTLGLRGREVDRAKPAAFGAPLPPGLYAFPNGLRMVYSKGTMCGIALTGCTCHDVHTANLEYYGREEFVSVDDLHPARALQHRFALQGGMFVVTR